jgi:hypothetical protein
MKNLICRSMVAVLLSVAALCGTTSGSPSSRCRRDTTDHLRRIMGLELPVSAEVRGIDRDSEGTTYALILMPNTEARRLKRAALESDPVRGRVADDADCVGFGCAGIGNLATPFQVPQRLEIQWKELGPVSDLLCVAYARHGNGTLFLDTRQGAMLFAYQCR